MEDDPLQAAFWCIDRILEIRALNEDVWSGGREMGELDAAIELQIILGDRRCSLRLDGVNLESCQA